MKITLTSILIFGLLFNCSSRMGQSTPEKLEPTTTPLSIGKYVSEIDDKVLLVFQDSKGDYWFGGNDQGAYRYDRFTEKKLVLFSKEDGLPHNNILGIQEDQAGNLYFDTPGGVSKYDGQQFNTLPIIQPIDPAQGWTLNPNDLWFRMGTDKTGPYRYDGTDLYQLKFPKSDLEDAFYAKYPNISYSPYGIYTTYKDRKGHQWFGTASLGVCRFDGRSLKWLYEKHLTETPGGGDFGFRSIIEDKDEYFWFCNSRYRYQVFANDSNATENNQLNYQREDGMGHLNQLLEMDYPYFLSVAEDNDGDLWMVTYDDGVYRNNGKKLIHYPVKDKGKNILLFSIFKDDQGVLWLGTHNGGVYKFNGKAFEKFKV